MNRFLIFKVGILMLTLLSISCQEEKNAALDQQITKESASYDDLVNLFQRWRDFEEPPLLEGAPDYRKQTFDKRWPEFKKIQNELMAMDTAGWEVPEKVDWLIVWAEMNGYDFNHRVLKPWVRDPAYYKTVWMARSDVPAHEGPTHHATLEWWTYELPLNQEKREQLIDNLKLIPVLNEQAKINLTGNARDLWNAGIRDIKYQSNDLSTIAAQESIKGDQEIQDLIEEAIASTDKFAQWLESQSESKDGPSGIGKENYTWHLQNVLLVPLTWEDEVTIHKRELARSWSSLKLEEHRNSALPPLMPASNEMEYDSLAKASSNKFLAFLKEKEILTIKPYLRPALEAHLLNFIPQEERNFFMITAHYDPTPLYTHFYHWFELARMDIEPHSSPIRRGPLLYNIFVSRNEGTATAVEEMFMDAGLYDDSPRSREIVYIMMAQRAARGLGSLYAHANMMSMEEAGGIHSEYTPRGWMKTEKELLIFEQHLYLRQPGYGTSYTTGKYLLEETLAEFAKQKENNKEEFRLIEFFDGINSIGNIPVSLTKWELTGVHHSYLIPKNDKDKK